MLNAPTWPADRGGFRVLHLAGLSCAPAMARRMVCTSRRGRTCAFVRPSFGFPVCSLIQSLICCIRNHFSFAGKRAMAPMHGPMEQGTPTLVDSQWNAVTIILVANASIPALVWLETHTRPSPPVLAPGRSEPTARTRGRRLGAVWCLQHGALRPTLDFVNRHDRNHEHHSNENHRNADDV